MMLVSLNVPDSQTPVISTL